MIEGFSDQLSGILKTLKVLCNKENNYALCHLNYRFSEESEQVFSFQYGSSWFMELDRTGW